MTTNLSGIVESYQDFVAQHAIAGFASTVRPATSLCRQDALRVIRLASVHCARTGQRAHVILDAPCLPREECRLQSDVTLYAAMAQSSKRVIFDMNFEASVATKAPNFFQFLSGAAFGPEALLALLRYYGWKQVALFYLNKADTTASAEAFATIAETSGIRFALRRRSSDTEVDRKVLESAESNVFIFFGGSSSLKSTFESRVCKRS
jgi:hypothetical protein